MFSHALLFPHVEKRSPQRAVSPFSVTGVEVTDIDSSNEMKLLEKAGCPKFPLVDEKRGVGLKNPPEKTTSFNDDRWD